MSYSESQYIIDEASKVNGIPPNPVLYTIALSDSGATVAFTKPDDTVIDGNILCRVKGILVVLKKDTPAKKPEDGTLLANLTGNALDSGTYSFTLPDNENTYYVSMFTYSDAGVVNYQTNSKRIGNMYKFAYHQDFTELNPDKTITYLDWGDLDSTAEPIHTNGDTGTVTYGNFRRFFILKQNKPYMVKSDWTADYALDPDDYTKKLDGSASDVSNTSYSGLGAYAWLPKFYMKEVYASDGNSRDVYFSNEKEDDDFIPLGFEDYSIGEVEGLWIPMYYAGSDGKSIAGRTGYGGTTNQYTNNQKTIIDLNGSNARFLGGSIMSALRDLEYGLYKSTDIQKHGGYGNCDGYNSSDTYKGMTTNPVLSNGAVSGFKGTGNYSDDSTRKQANKAFHSNVLFTYDMSLRDPYTLFYTSAERRGTVRIRSKYTYDIYGGSTDANDVTFAASALRTRSSGTSSKLEISDAGSGQKQSINYGNNGGSNTTGLCDWDQWGSTATKTYVANRLGNYHYDPMNGPAFLYLDRENSYKSTSLGAAPLIIPPANYKP